MVQVKTVNNSFPNDPIEIDPKPLLEKFTIQAGVEGVVYFIERGPGPNVKIDLITDIAA